MQPRLTALALILFVPWTVRAQVPAPPTAASSLQAKPTKQPGEIEITNFRPVTREVKESVTAVVDGKAVVRVVTKTVCVMVPYSRKLVVDGVTIKATKKDGTPVGPNELARLLEANGKVLIFPNGVVDPAQVKAAAEGTVIIAGDSPGEFGVPTQNSGVRDSLRNGMRWVWGTTQSMLRPW